MTTHYGRAFSGATTKQTDVDGWEHDVTDLAFATGRSMGVCRAACGREIVLSLWAFGRPCPDCQRYRALAAACVGLVIKTSRKHRRPGFVESMTRRCGVGRR
jgi:hypothetical protein